MALIFASFPSMVTLYIRMESSELGYWTHDAPISGFSFFFVGIYFLFMISILFTFLLRLKLGLISGIAGCIIMAINLFFPSLFFSPMIQSIGEGTSTPLDRYYLIGYSISENLFIFIIWILFCVINIILFLGKVIVKGVNFRIIKKTILDLGTQYANLEVREISEACYADKVTIIDTIQEMIENTEIYAEYFKSSKTVAFNKQANIEEIDTLMATFRDWEENLEKKI